MASLNVTQLDFASIKANLKTYLAAQEEFSDYDFTGSALNVLLDVLSYNTHYNAVLANLVANEMFIDTAIKRSSVVSIAKTLGYTPRSTTSSKAIVNLVVDRVNTVGTTLTLGKNNKFSASINNNAYTFNVNETQVATLTGENTFVFENVELIEGTRLSNSYVATTDLLSGPFILPNDNADTTTIEVQVTFDNVTTSYIKKDNIVDVTSTSKVFWIEENNNGQTQIVFGDDIVGAKLDAGSVVTASYVASNGSISNGARNFTLIGTIDGEDQVTITVLSPASGGAEKENIDTIRFNAPKYNATRNRAITSEDYRTLIKQNLPKAREVTVWGGEENDPPIFGKVFISIDPTTGSILTEADKNFITETVLRPRSVMSIQHEFVDPDYVYLGFEGVVNYNPKLTSLKSTDISALANAEILDYFADELGTLNRTFFLSRLLERIKLIDDSVVSSVFDLRLQKRITIGTNTTSGFAGNLNYLTAIDPETVVSSRFVSTINGLSYTGYLQDFSDDQVQNDSGTGTIKFINEQTNLPVTTVGLVDYESGIITFNNLNVTRYLGNVNQVYLSLRPQPLYQNITSGVVRTSDISQFAVSARPAKNTIITLDNSTSNSTANILPGIVINSRPYSE